MQSYLELLKEFISFKSISTDASYSSDLNACAEWLNNQFTKNKFSSKTIEGYGNEIVLAKFSVSETAKTILIYGHYDVQPAQISEGWNSDPFKVTQVEDRLFARGIVDNKGQVLIHISTIFELIKENSLKYNVIFLIEGNEETGSPNLERFVNDYAKELKADFVLFSDGELTAEHPTIETGFRGIVNLKLEIETSKKDNHSGLYGGAIQNSAKILSELISNLQDESGILKLEGLDNSLNGIDLKILNDNKEIPFNEDEFLNITGASTRLNSDINLYLLTGFLTSAEITSITAGYQGIGYRNAIPGISSAKINFRVSPKHTAIEVQTAFENYIKNSIPKFAKYLITVDECINPININLDNEFTKIAKDVLDKVYQKRCYFKACGAIVPIAGLFQEILKIPVISAGLGNEDCNMHGANENFEISLIEKGLEFSRKFLS